MKIKATTKIIDTNGAHFAVFVELNLTEPPGDVRGKVELRGEGFHKSDAIADAIEKMEDLAHKLKAMQSDLKNK